MAQLTKVTTTRGLEKLSRWITKTRNS